jgi:putative FmdB family regulatory protein
MPIYEYKCDDSNKVITRFCKMSDQKDHVCICGGKLQSQLSVPFVNNANSGGRND